MQLGDWGGLALEDRRDEARLRFALERAAAGGWHLFFEHDPDVVVAGLERSDRGGVVTTGHRPLQELF